MTPPTRRTDHALLSDFSAHLAKERASTADLLSYLAEFDARRLYLSKGFSSMYDYCVEALGLPEDEAAERIEAGRAARRFPEIFHAIADGRLHLSAVVLLSPHLTEETAEGLIAAAVHKTSEEVMLLLAARFPRPEGALPPRAVPLSDATGQLASKRVVLHSNLEPDSDGA